MTLVMVIKDTAMGDARAYLFQIPAIRLPCRRKPNGNQYKDTKTGIVYVTIMSETKKHSGGGS